MTSSNNDSSDVSQNIAEEPKKGRRHRPPKKKEGGLIRVSSKVEEHLKNIGRPEEQEFVPDPFQLEAVDLIRDHDVIVSAPTGSGKTWIAEKAIAAELALGRRTWYASPLKALSNSKFLEF